FKFSEVFQAGSRFLDLDIAVEGNAEKLACSIKENKDLKFELNYLRVHKKFGTALMEFSVKNIPLKIDMASFRTEVYKKSGVLPEVNTGSANLNSDISRRDFTINTVVFSINRKDFLAVKDYACGLSDILNKKIRVLHDLSFIDDPTRIFRAVRFEKRLGFKIEQKTLKLMKSALNKNVMDNISGKRIIAEMYLLLKEKKPEIYFERLEKLGVLSRIYGKLKFDSKNKTAFKKISSYFNGRDKAVKSGIGGKGADINIFYIAEIFYGLNSDELSEAIGRLNLGNRIQKTLENIYSDAEELNNLKKNERFKLKLKNAEIYNKLKIFGINGILFYFFRSGGKYKRDSDFRKIILRYLNKIVFVKPFVNGNDIKLMGICEGLLCGKILDELKLLKIDGKLKSKDDELKYIKKNYINK
ncbi:MAG: tRNA nucleotidyltransferase/poly(A) polymerase family protein, partial [bacterium]